MAKELIKQMIALIVRPLCVIVFKLICFMNDCAHYYDLLINKYNNNNNDNKIKLSI